ncbi:hypothetical protein [Uliginosibacterium gangwonense]|uniref:hypothetical protein n=1 Tax=Uliginosibacterium gangwonense TaxID=392736 RepID=UPI00036D27D6|nr:hypothetical protein [Uliginosibacterium gangwonense]
MNTSSLRTQTLAITLSMLGMLVSIGGTLYLMHLAEVPDAYAQTQGTPVFSMAQSTPTLAHPQPASKHSLN